MKKFIAVLLSSTTIFTCSTTVFADNLEITKAMEIKNAKKNRIEVSRDILADNSKKVFVDDKQLQLKEGNIVYEDRVFLPVRELGEALGLQVEYSQEEKIVTLNGGKIQLPVNENKAVVNGQILAIDKENDKVGTIMVNNKTYLPLRFISESLGYNVDYNSKNEEIHIKTITDTNNNYITKLDKTQAVEAYNQINKASENIKNATVDVNGDINFTISDGTSNLDMKMNIASTMDMDISDKVNMYTEQKSTTELMGEKETVDQKMFYQDGKVYVKQMVNGNEFKYKMDLDLDQVMEMANSMKVNDYLNEEVILDATVKDLENGNKEYTFNLDMSKAIDIAKQLTEELSLAEEDLQALDSIIFKDVKTIVNVDNKNQPIGYKMDFSILLSAEGLDIKADINMDMKYKNIGTTVVKIPNEDLTQYEDFDKLINEDTLEDTTK